MNPDFDDFDDVPSQQSDEPRSRTLPRLVVGVAVAAFIALACYAYQSGSDSMKTGDIEFVEAGAESYKERPSEPGGEEFLHKDKTIYDAISPYTGDDAPKVEKLLPEPEQPVKPKERTESNADSWVSEEIRHADKKAASEEETTSPEDIAVKSAIDASEKNAVEKTDAVSEEVKKPVAAPVASKTDVKSTPATPVKPKPEAPAPKPEPVSKTTEPVSGSYKIQLGAYKTEAEAKRTASRIATKNKDILGSQDYAILRADLPAGTFYRLRFSGFATPDAAKTACQKLASRGQGCFYAGK